MNDKTIIKVPDLSENALLIAPDPVTSSGSHNRVRSHGHFGGIDKGSG